MTDLAPIRFWLESLIRPIIREVLKDEMADLKPFASPQPTTGKRYLSAKEAADFMGIKLQTLYQNIERVPHAKKHGKLLFMADGLIEYVEGSKERGQKQ